MDKRSEARVQANYQSAVANNKPVSSKWTAEDGTARSLKVAKPVKVAGPTGNCKQITASMSTPGGAQQMPAETYCQGTDGVWRPA
jgi:surface antigen